MLEFTEVEQGPITVVAGQGTPLGERDVQGVLGSAQAVHHLALIVQRQTKTHSGHHMALVVVPGDVEAGLVAALDEPEAGSVSGIGAGAGRACRFTRGGQWRGWRRLSNHLLCCRALALGVTGRKAEGNQSDVRVTQRRRGLVTARGKDAGVQERCHRTSSQVIRSA